MKLLKLSGNAPLLQSQITETVKVLNAGGLVIYPTETCYGVAVDATNPEAVKKLLQYKDRPEGKAISVAVSDQAMAEKYVHLNEQAINIYQKFLPGPVTVISRSKGLVVKELESETGSLGIRIPAYPLILTLIKQFGKPITATSANKSGAKTPYTLADIWDNLPRKKQKLVDLVLDAGELPHNPPSTVIDTTLENMVVYRTGEVVLGEKMMSVSTNSTEETIAIGKRLMDSQIQNLGKKVILILLHGNMGAGKTYFTKGIARSLGIINEITSPTYTYYNEFSLAKGIKFFHADVWRLEKETDFLLLEPEIWFKEKNVVVIEWADRISNALQGVLAKNQMKNYEVLNVQITILSEERRQIEITI